ncbi:MAG: AAA family ATPase, partial [Thermodesulfobacteriota bacterium]
MLTELGLENFKAFQQKQRIPLRPITLLFGANSSGKTSILQTLLLLKQTLEEAESSETVLLPKGKTIDLGSYKELIYAHDTQRSLNLSFTFMGESTGPQRRPWVYSRLPSGFLEQPFECSLSFAADRRGRFRLEGYSIGIGNDLEKLASFQILSPKKAKEFPGFRPLLSSKMGPKYALTFFSLKDFNSEHSLIRTEWSRFQNALPRLLKDLERQQLRLEAHLGRFSTEEYTENTVQGERVGKKVERRLEEIQSEKRKVDTSLRRLREYSLGHYLEDARKANENAILGFAHFLPMAGPFLPRETRERSYAFEDRASMGIPMIAELASLIGMQFRSLRETVIYLGPLREYPERHYIFSGNVVSDVGKSGKFMPDLLFSNQSVVK